MTTSWMIYGANGYTGGLIAREAVKQGLKPTLAGRSLEKIKPLAQELGLEAISFSLDNHHKVEASLQGYELVLNCAGPFSATAEPMMQACLKVGAHYLDITGEIAIFERAQALNEQAKAANIVLCPGVGFDVIPTDCVAASLKGAMPDATHLALGFDSRSGFSPGTAKTSIEGMAQGGKVRIEGEIKTVPLAYKVRHIDFGDGTKPAMTIPWGDVSTAYYSTGIPNVEVYLPGSMRFIRSAKLGNLMRPALKVGFVQHLIKKRIGKTVKGPNEEQRAKLPTYVWGEVRNAKGEIKTARIKTANAYSLTVTGALTITQHLLQQAPEAGGAYTPSLLMGKSLVEQLPGSGTITIE